MADSEIIVELISVLSDLNISNKLLVQLIFSGWHPFGHRDREREREELNR